MKWNVISILFLILTFGVIFFLAPEDAEQGILQKIFYLHVSCALLMYFYFFLSFLSSLFYLLIQRKNFWDEICVSSIEVGFLLCSMVLATGPFWAKPTWGVWWTWEPRLTTTLLVWILYASYLLLRSYFRGSSRQKVLTSTVAILAFLDVPLIHFSVRLWRGIHPIVLTQGGGGISSHMKWVFLLSLLALFFFSLVLFLFRWKLEMASNQLQQMALHQQGES